MQLLKYTINNLSLFNNINIQLNKLKNNKKT